MEFLKANQLNIMLFLGGMCGILAIMTLATEALNRKTKLILAFMEIFAMLMLLFDRLAAAYDGIPGTFAHLMVRIGNGMVYFLCLAIPFLVTRYLTNLYMTDCHFKRQPKALFISEMVFIAGFAVLLISQFTDIYYYFDEQNVYYRAKWHLISSIVPFVMIVLQEFTILRYARRLRRRLVVSMFVCIALPTLAAVAQIFLYGLSLVPIVTAVVVVVFYGHTLGTLSEAAEKARLHELIVLKEAKEKEAALFEETTEALAHAIDAKDAYTSGHSTRVALYSRQIAKEAGLDEEACKQVYFSALLHDVGKIGIRKSIINKPGRLTDEEYDHIKTHPVLGDQILSSIKQAPFLCAGARYHHERYDGKGYPDGLAGENIPEIARIIAVADAYDAMTSARSYRDPLPRAVVRQEIEKGVGTQFDPRFATIMLRLIDREDEDNLQSKGA